MLPSMHFGEAETAAAGVDVIAPLVTARRPSIEVNRAVEAMASRLCSSFSSLRITVQNW